jgi:Plasma-membrane choline transporter
MFKDSNGHTQETPIMVTAIPSYGTEPVLVTIDELVSTDNEATPLVVSHDVDKDAMPVFRDVPFAILFLIHVAIMLWLGIAVAPKGYSVININFDDIEGAMKKGEDVTEEDVANFEDFIAFLGKYVQVYPERILLYFLAPTGVLAFLIATTATAVVIKPCPRTITYACLLWSFVLSAIGMISSTIAHFNPFSLILTVVILFGVAYYVRLAWRVVPFAAVNLKGALEGMSRNCGVYLVAFCAAEVGFVWPLYWIYVVIGVSAHKRHQCVSAHPELNFDIASDDSSDVCDPPPAIFLLFLLSLYWTSTVIVVRTSPSCPRRKENVSHLHSCRIRYRFRWRASWLRGALINARRTIAALRQFSVLYTVA